MKHHLTREAFNAGKIRVTYVRMEHSQADLFIKSLDIQKIHKHAKTVLNVS